MLVLVPIYNLTRVSDGYWDWLYETLSSVTAGLMATRGLWG